MLALFVAAAAVVAAWAALAAVAAGSPPRAATRLELEPLPRVEPAPIPALTPPPALQEGVARSVPRRRAGTAEVQLSGAPGPAPACGIGVLDGESSALLAWQDLTGVALPTRVELSDLPAGDHLLVLATDRALVRHSYAVRAPLAMREEGAGVRGAAQLEVALHSVTVELQWQGASAGPRPVVVPELRRLDDARWRYRTAGPVAWGGGAGQALAFVGLGPGRYELVLDGAEVLAEDRDRLLLEVGGSIALTVRCRP